MNWVFLLLGVYILALGIYNITANPDKGSLVTNAILVAIGAGLMYFGYSK
jgi:hypothetical protein